MKKWDFVGFFFFLEDNDSEVGAGSRKSTQTP